MKRALLHSLPAMLLLGPSLLGCSPAPRDAISMEDATEVLSLAANAMTRVKELPTGYCVVTQLDPSKTVASASNEVNGWSTASKDVAYRRISSPTLRELPKQAIHSFPTFVRRADCRHPLKFHEPEFLEVRQRAETFIVAIVAIDDLCPLCGAGYSASLKKSGKRWKMDPPDIGLSWVS